MSIIELIEKAGVGNVRCQWLHESMTNVQLRKNGHTAVTFLTKEINPTQVANDSDALAIVVWIPRDKL